MIEREELQDLALNLIYTVDYDIGKEADPEVYGDAEELIDEVRKEIERFLEMKGVNFNGESNTE